MIADLIRDIDRQISEVEAKPSPHNAYHGGTNMTCAKVGKILAAALDHAQQIEVLMGRLPEPLPGPKKSKKTKAEKE